MIFYTTFDTIISHLINSDVLTEAIDGLYSFVSSNAVKADANSITISNRVYKREDNEQVDCLGNTLYLINEHGIQHRLIAVNTKLLKHNRKDSLAEVSWEQVYNWLEGKNIALYDSSRELKIFRDEDSFSFGGISYDKDTLTKEARFYIGGDHRLVIEDKICASKEKFYCH